MRNNITFKKTWWKSLLNGLNWFFSFSWIFASKKDDGVEKFFTDDTPPGKKKANNTPTDTSLINGQGRSQLTFLSDSSLRALGNPPSSAEPTEKGEMSPGTENTMIKRGLLNKFQLFTQQGKRQKGKRKETSSTQKTQSNIFSSFFAYITPNAIVKRRMGRYQHRFPEIPETKI